jgi:hypothetical protein
MKVIKGTAWRSRVQRVQRERLTPAPRAKGFCPSGAEGAQLRYGLCKKVVPASAQDGRCEGGAPSFQLQPADSRPPHPSTFFTASSRFSVKSIFPKFDDRGSFSLRSERRQNSAFPSFRHRSNTWPPSFLSSER